MLSKMRDMHGVALMGVAVHCARRHRALLPQERTTRPHKPVGDGAVRAGGRGMQLHQPHGALKVCARAWCYSARRLAKRTTVTPARAWRVLGMTSTQSP